MDFPAGFLDELRARISMAQVAGRRVVWDLRKSNQGKGDMWAPCPFHQEKTASFHVDDRKGVYYCFGCHAKGNAITFVRETENVSFVEAVEILAREVGMEIPAPDPKAKEKADHQTELSEVVEQAIRHYRLQLKTFSAAEAREYLDRRGLSEEVIDHWEIGFAPDRRQGLFEHLTGKSVAADLVIDAGLVARPDDGGAPYDRFRGRIIFPIRDGRGRAIALGGRAMNPEARAKYLNSPETELFHKGRTLFNFGPARTAAGKGQRLIVAEGYMDVIALSEAGFEATVAPLGTAITSEQLAFLWRVSSRPVIMLDGDRAGLNAAMRLVDLALPSVTADRSLDFCIMPQGKDPDDVIRAGGADAIRTELDRAQSLFSMLWRREGNEVDFSSPEQRAALEKRIRDLIARISDTALRGTYFQEVKDRLFRMRRRMSPGPQRGIERAKGARDSTKMSRVATNDPDVVVESQLLAIIVNFPDILPRVINDIEALELVDPLHAIILEVMLDCRDGASELRALLMDRIGTDTLEEFVSRHQIPISPKRRGLDYVHLVVSDTLSILRARRSAKAEADEALESRGGLTSEVETRRLKDAAEARFLAESGPKDDRVEYDIAPSGAKVIRAERVELDRALGGISFVRPGRGP